MCWRCSVGWRSLAGWYVGGAVDSRDTGNDVQVVFLHCPPLEASAHPPDVETYVVQPGDSLWKIAVKYYNDGNLWNVIHAANRSKIANPNLIYAGQKLVIP